MGISDTRDSFRKRARAAGRRLRELRFLMRSLLSTDRPVMAHLIPVRRCNLSCGYCNEYDRSSDPVPLETVLARVDRLAALGTGCITISGGEPLLHPALEGVVARIRKHGMLAGLISNGYLLTADRIRALNHAGLDHLQISIDNVAPDVVSKKSLKTLDPKLELLAAHADFHVNINSVLGSGVRNPQDALTVARRAVELGFTSTVGIVHDGMGQVRPLGPAERAIYEAVRRLGKAGYARLNGFQKNIVEGRPNQWRCRAGARYLYVCEKGLVHYCSQQRGYPAIPLSEYTVEDIRREFLTVKSCAPACTVSCVHQVSYVDFWRAPQFPSGEPEQPVPALFPIFQADGSSREP